MAGERDLDVLLKDMRPVLSPDRYVFVSIAAGTPVNIAALDPICFFREAEGLTLILDQARAVAAGLASGPVMACITLTVHSSLEAVGLTAAVAMALARADIAANVVAAYYHDHVFVPAADAQQAMAVLEALAR